MQTELDSPPDPSTLIEPLVAQGKLIHSKLLFDIKYGEKLLKTFLLGITATPNSYMLPGWKNLAAALKIDVQLIKCIENFRSHEVPIYWAFYAFSNNGVNATLDKIIKALEEIKRFDIIQQVFTPFLDLCQEVNKDYSQNVKNLFKQENGIISTHISNSNISLIFKNVNRNKNEVNFNSSSSSNSNQEQIWTIKPDIYENRHINNESLQRASPSETKEEKKKKYARKVLLTFSNDGIEEAQNLTKFLRNSVNENKNIGVVILNEQANHVNANPIQCILDWFHQVDYVIPIITEGYLRDLENRELINSSSFLDPKYTKYISELMFANYIQTGCENYKVRCFIPEKFRDLLQTHPKMSDPLFSVWWLSSEIDSFCKSIIKGS